MPIERPAIRTLRFFIAAAIIGTKGGEQMKDVEQITIVSASIRNRRARIVCRIREPKITKLR